MRSGRGGRLKFRDVSKVMLDALANGVRIEIAHQRDCRVGRNVVIAVKFRRVLGGDLTQFVDVRIGQDPLIHGIREQKT